MSNHQDPKEKNEELPASTDKIDPFEKALTPENIEANEEDAAAEQQRKEAMTERD